MDKVSCYLGDQLPARGCTTPVTSVFDVQRLRMNYLNYAIAAASRMIIVSILVVHSAVPAFSGQADQQTDDHSSQFEWKSGAGAITSLKHAHDSLDTEYILAGRRLGDAILPTAKPAAIGKRSRPRSCPRRVRRRVLPTPTAPSATPLIGFRRENRMICFSGCILISRIKRFCGP